MVSSLRLDVDARRRKVDEILATVRGSAVFCWDFSLQRWMAQTGTEDLKLVHSKLWQGFFWQNGLKPATCQEVQGWNSVVCRGHKSKRKLSSLGAVSKKSSKHVAM